MCPGISLLGINVLRPYKDCSLPSMTRLLRGIVLASHDNLYVSHRTCKSVQKKYICNLSTYGSNPHIIYLPPSENRRQHGHTALQQSCFYKPFCRRVCSRAQEVCKSNSCFRVLQ
jgi:hypothetical protein